MPTIGPCVNVFWYSRLYLRIYGLGDGRLVELWPGTPLASFSFHVMPGAQSVDMRNMYCGWLVNANAYVYGPDKQKPHLAGTIEVYFGNIIIIIIILFMRIYMHPN